MAQRPTFNRVWNYISSSLQDFANVLSPYMGGGNNLKAGTKELTLDDTGTMTLNTGDLTITTDSINGDDIVVRATDRVTIQGGNKLLNDSNSGGNAYLYAGNGSSSDGIADAGDGGSARVYAGDAGTNTGGGAQGFGGNVFIKGGYTTSPSDEGGAVFIYGGNSTDGIVGNVVIGEYYRNWIFNENDGTLACPPVTFSVLPSASGNAGMRAIINDSTVVAAGAFGAIAVGGGNKVVPVFSDGSDWLIG